MDNYRIHKQPPIPEYKIIATIGKCTLETWRDTPKDAMDYAMALNDAGYDVQLKREKMI